MVHSDGFMYVFGGSTTSTEGKFFDDFWRFSIDAWRWDQQPMTEPRIISARHSHSMFSWTTCSASTWNHSMRPGTTRSGFPPFRLSRTSSRRLPVNSLPCPTRRGDFHA
eukprot:994380_1